MDTRSYLRHIIEYFLTFCYSCELLDIIIYMDTLKMITSNISKKMFYGDFNLRSVTIGKSLLVL